jgi:hypothetical protein
VVAVGAAVAVYAAPLAIAYLGESSTGAWILSARLGITGAIGTKAGTITVVSAGGLVTGLAAKPLSGLRWPTLNPKAPHMNDLSTLYLDREDHAVEGSSVLGLLFERYYQAKLAGAIDAIQNGLMPGGTWPGWQDVKIIPALIQDEYKFITGFDHAVYRQLIAGGASSGQAYLQKVRILLGFWKKLEEFLIDHRGKHNYQGRFAGDGTVAGLKAELGLRKAELDQALAAQRR